MHFISDKKAFSVFESFEKSFIILLIAAVLVFGSAALGKVQLGGYDESAYHHYTTILNNHGVRGIRRLIQEYPHDEFLQKAPSPLRILFVFMGLLSCKLLHNCGMESLALISFLSGISLILVAFCLFRKWFAPTVAFLAASLLIVSPLGLALSRRALHDSFFTLIVISSILFYHHCWTRKKIIDPFIFGLLILAGFLTKESMIFLYPCFLVSGIYYRQKISSSPLLKVLAPLLLAPLAYFLIISWVSGGAQIFIKHYLFYSQMASKIEYALRFQKGPWFRYIVDFILLSPAVAILAAMGAVSFIQDERNRKGRDIAASYLLCGLAVFSVSPILNVRIVFWLDVLLRALAIFGILAIGDKIRTQRYAYILMALLYLSVIASDCSQFYVLFVKSGIYDPVTAVLIEGNGLIR